MNRRSQGRIIGIDASRDWLDVHCLPDGHRERYPNRADGHAAVVALARERSSVVCFEATGRQEWKLWMALDAAGIIARQVPPAQAKAFARSRGTGQDRQAGPFEANGPLRADAAPCGT